MPQAPNIVVQLIHIQGPLKGEIQEFSDSEITIGRHPSCNIQFPKDLAIISRNHARIVRDGNRHKLIDESTNGTFVNGKAIREVYLKSGDVLTFAEEGGPKVSFLTEMKPFEPAETPTPIRQPDVPKPPAPKPKPVEPNPPPRKQTIETPVESFREPTPDPIPERPKETKEIPIERVKVPLAIQYGPTLRAFKELPITIGRKPDCDFSLEHPAILDRHAQIFFSVDSYGIKDLTGKSLITLNGQPIHPHALLTAGDRIHLSTQGPKFQFMAGGRLAEIDESQNPEQTPDKPEPETRSDSGPGDKKKSMLNKLFQR